MNKSNAFRYTKIMLVHWCIDFVLKLLIGVQAVLSMAENDRRLKFHHINTSLHLMVPPWQASLHKLPVVVGKKSAMPFHHGGAMAAI